MDILIQKQIKFHSEKITHLEKELEARTSAGTKRINKAEAELRLELDRIREQIRGHKEKIEDLKRSA
jgi:hypothetical protein